MKNTICHIPEIKKKFKTGKKVQQGKIYRQIIENFHLWHIFNKTQRKTKAVYLLIKLATVCTCN